MTCTLRGVAISLQSCVVTRADHVWSRLPPSMKPAPFSYYAPTSLDEAVALLAELGPQDGRILAGGQSLVPTMAFRMARPAHLIDINGIAELATVTVKDDVLEHRRLRTACGLRSRYVAGSNWRTAA